MMDCDTALIVPTKGRRELFRRLVKAVRKTAGQTVDIYAVVCQNETREYLEVIKELNTTGRMVRIITVQDDYNYPQKLNMATSLVHRNYRYLALWNDDHEPLTLFWDQHFKAAIGEDPFGLAYGFDGIWEHGQVPSAPFLTSSFVTTLGWAALPGLQHILVDNVWKDLAAACGVCHFLPEVVVQHHHLDNGEAEPDDTYAETQGNELRNQMDREVWWAWLESPTRTENELALAALFDPPIEVRRPTA